jgi:hypothetical protein
MGKNMVDVVVKIKFSNNKYSQVFNRVCPGYGALAEFIIIDQYVGVPGKDITFVLLILSFTQL